MALDRKTGAVKWQRLAPEPAENSFGGYAGTLALAGDRVIAAGFDGNLIALPSVLPKGWQSGVNRDSAPRAE